MTRKAVFIAVVGSTNYNLKTPSSDVDKKLFVYPTFDDLYKGEKLSKSKTSVLEDVEEHDIRKLPQMLWKSNVNFIEVLFSQDYTQSFAPGAIDLVEYLVGQREEIARMNLPYLFDACFGMFLGKKKDFERDINFVNFSEDAERRHLAICKHAYSAARIADFLLRYYYRGFNDFGGAIYYDDKDSFRKVLLDIKKGDIPGGRVTYDYLADLLVSMEKHMLIVKEHYKSQPRNEELSIWVNDVVKEAVTMNIKNELEGK